MKNRGKSNLDMSKIACRASTLTSCIFPVLREWIYAVARPERPIDISKGLLITINIQALGRGLLTWAALPSLKEELIAVSGQPRSLRCERISGGRSLASQREVA